MPGQIVGYARVSTKEQDLAVQLEALKSEGCEEIFHGKQSGISKENDMKLEELVKYVRKGDVVVCTKLDRLGRSLKSILNTIDRIHGKGAFLRTLDGAVDTSSDNPFARAMVSLLGVFAQLERDLIVGRTSEGRTAAKAKGVKFGRKAALSDEQRAAIRKRKAKGESVSSLAADYGVGRPTIYRALETK